MQFTSLVFFALASAGVMANEYAPIMERETPCKSSYQYCGWYLSEDLGYPSTLSSGLYFCNPDGSVQMVTDCGQAGCCGSTAHCC